MQKQRNSGTGLREPALRRDIATEGGNVVLISGARNHIEDPSYKSSILAFGPGPEFLKFFNGLLIGSHRDWVSKAAEEDFPKENPVERITIHNALTPDGKMVEATPTKPYSPSDPKVRLPRPQEESIGFEAVLMRKGSVSYDIYQGFNEWARTTKGKKYVVTLQPGNLLIIPRGVARRVSGVKQGSEYLYIGDSWEDDPPLNLAEVLRE